MEQPLWKTVGWLLTKLNILLLYDPTVKLIGIYPKELITYFHIKICIWKFTAA